ncbi:NAD(P)-dependent dehydrogenase (short-subunit alcohol dehydrogenase family) [Aliiruegeria haliotis]|uniref:NAD(P)-dependent dehydrogenase (Short-subunit alcohol dehydrogenase family) n=1 Tax=Aliiruegeria haliotis TaxID=1280846 RepID=A0A2T0RWG5_9RHOB|nr:SDR family oxidoreductase [Aliiruegeria haliotis]PRY25500.1 NAD(P)-dependent dehydrogenase (short-subunit alcohol dehydrogenase family) [Aliiruegeria haliotis]
MPANTLITGANRGIGRSMAAALAATGNVIGTYRDTPPDARGIRWERLDVASPDSQQALAKRIEGLPVDLLVCNAGVFLDKGHRLEDGYAQTLWEQSFATNVTGVFMTIRSLLPNLRLSHTPRIAIISSKMASDAGAPGGSYIYRASKAAVLNLGRNLAVDLAPEGIAVGIYHPGWVRTDMGSAAADISVEESAMGLLERFDALSPETTGTFQNYDGTPIAF